MSQPGTDDQPVPLGFKVIVTLAGLYLLLRLAQGVIWLIQRIG